VRHCIAAPRYRFIGRSVRTDILRGSVNNVDRRKSGLEAASNFGAVRVVLLDLSLDLFRFSRFSDRVEGQIREVGFR
jgi:hypothetical protein